ncbi:MAG: flavodoxin family protein [Candidatus Wallbacteria bacterium]|nr:flavodoxin family protein [Candidatus Wallbacteria bacterium]
MRILALNGSPRKSGNCSKIIDKICRTAEKKGHQFTVYPLYDLVFGGCLACETCKSETGKCPLKDDFTRIKDEIIQAGCLIIASPVYMGQITGPLKTFLDRFYIFVTADFQIRDLKGKKFATVITCGAPADQFRYVGDYLQHWFKDFFHLESLGGIVAGNLGGPGIVSNKPDVMKEAQRIGGAI